MIAVFPRVESSSRVFVQAPVGLRAFGPYRRPGSESESEAVDHGRLVSFWVGALFW